MWLCGALRVACGLYAEGGSFYPYTRKYRLSLPPVSRNVKAEARRRRREREGRRKGSIHHRHILQSFHQNVPFLSHHKPRDR